MLSFLNSLEFCRLVKSLEMEFCKIILFTTHSLSKLLMILKGKAFENLFGKKRKCWKKEKMVVYTLSPKRIISNFESYVFCCLPVLVI